MSAQTLGFAVQPEDRPVLDELVAYFGDGNRSAYLRATLKVMKSIMIADQLRAAQAYGQQRTAELGIDPSGCPAARIQEFLKGLPEQAGPVSPPRACPGGRRLRRQRPGDCGSERQQPVPVLAVTAAGLWERLSRLPRRDR